MIFSADELKALKQRESDVPCGTCTACCRRDLIHLTDDERDRFDYELVNGRAVLKRKEDGSCAHLTARGCGIYENRPSICRRFDCRVLFLSTPKAMRRMRVEQNPTMATVYQAGKARLGTLHISENEMRAV